MEILKQGLNEPMLVENQIAIIYCGTKGLLNDIPIDKIKSFEEDFLSTLRSESVDVLEAIRNGLLTEDVVNTLEKTCEKIKKNHI